MMRLASRHRGENDQAKQKHGDIEIGDLKAKYPALRRFRDSDIIAAVHAKYGIKSLSELPKKVHTKSHH